MMNQHADVHKTSRFSMRVVLFAFLIIAYSCLIHNAFAEEPSGTLEIRQITPYPTVNQEFSVSVWLSNPQFVHYYVIRVEYPDIWRLARIQASDSVPELVFFSEEVPGGKKNTTLEADIGFEDPFPAGRLCTLTFEPMEAGNKTIEIIDAFFLSNSDTARANSPSLNINVAAPLTPVITVASGTKHGPFNVEVTFRSGNRIVHKLNGDVSISYYRGVTGFEPSDIIIGGTAGASLIDKHWGLIIRINPTRSGTVRIQIPANTVTEEGTGVQNVASEVLTVNVVLNYPPWDVNEDGSINQDDVDLVDAAIGQGLVDISDGNGYIYISTIDDPRTDVDGDMYVTEEDKQLVIDNLD